MSFVPKSLEAGAGWMVKHTQDMFRENFLTGNNRYSLKFSQCRFSFFLTKGNIFSQNLEVMTIHCRKIGKQKSTQKELLPREKQC